MHGMYSLISGYRGERYRIPKIQSTDLKSVNKLESPSQDASVSPTWEREESNHKWRGREGTGRVSGWGREWVRERNLIWFWVREKD